MVILNLWNYLRGYVIIEVNGFSIERFVNMALHRGVYIWDLKYFNNKVRMKVSIKGFKLLKGCAKKTKCKVYIIEKAGTPFFLFRYRKRKVLVGGVAFFVLIVYFLSSFIWLVEVEGYEHLDHYELVNFLANNGLKVGAYKGNIDKNQLEQLMSYNFREISFINIEIKGTRATISLTEIIPEIEIIDRTSPNDIIATKDGLIDSIYTSAGTPLVQAGDVVSKGDLLVTGELILRNDETGTIIEYVHSIAEIKAKLYYTMSFNIPIEYTENQQTGETKKHLRFSIMNRNIDFIPFSNKYKNYYKTTSLRQLSLGENYPLPIIIYTDTYTEYKPVIMQRSVDEMKDIADQIITDKILQELDFNIDIIDRLVEYKEVEEGLNVEVLISTIEDIGEDRPIIIEAPLQGLEEVFE